MWTLVGRDDARIYRTAEAVPERVVVVFGAGYWPDGTPSRVMGDRCTGQTAFVAPAQAFGSVSWPCRRRKTA